jgi:hypothetical protein
VVRLAGALRTRELGSLADGALAAGFLPTAGVARLLVVFVGAEFLLDPASLQQLLEPPEGGPDVFPIVNPHPQSHAGSLVTALRFGGPVNML